jgi:hypothetical protein
MSKRPLKYQEYLSKYNNCPPPNCIEKDKICYRWVHENISEKDFIPIQLHPDYPPRILDTSDKECIGHGLSFYAELEAARNVYLHLYNRCQRKWQKEKFVLEKGKRIAELDIKKEDGVQSEPNNPKHITFYQYEECPFLDRINSIFDTFV